MVFTVHKSTGFNSDKEYQSYVDLLEEIGIDVANAPRVPESGTSHRWLYVWRERLLAERFARELNKRLRDHSWEVKEVAAPTPDSGALAPLQVVAFATSTGTEFQLTQASQERILAHFPNALLRGSIEFENLEPCDFDQKPELIWNKVVLPLAGVSERNIDYLGGVRVIDDETEATIFAQLPVLR